MSDPETWTHSRERWAGHASASTFLDALERSARSFAAVNEERPA